VNAPGGSCLHADSTGGIGGNHLDAAGHRRAAAPGEGERIRVTFTAFPFDGWEKNMKKPMKCCWLVVWNMAFMTFSSYWECHHPN